MEEDHSGDVLLELLGLRREEQLAVLTPVVLVVLDADLGQTLPHRACRAKPIHMDTGLHIIQG